MARITDNDKLFEVAKELKTATNGKVDPKPVPREACSYNCWGFVAHAAKWRDTLHWMEEDTMMELLNTRTEVISKDEAKAGDILAYYREGGTDWLIHTALVVKPGELVLHKRGTCEPSLEHPEDEPYYQPSNMVYLRIKEE